MGGPTDTNSLYDKNTLHVLSSCQFAAKDIGTYPVSDLFI